MNFVITATGTDSGKTYVACGLAQVWRNQGLRVAALKPVASGYDDAQMATSDAGLLLAACGRLVSQQSIATIAPWRYAAALAPSQAAALAGHQIDIKKVATWCIAAARNAQAERVLIEGAGGVMTPLSDTHTQRDWLAAMNMPVLLVTGSYLGTLSHTLTALAALREVKVRPSAILINGGITCGLGAPLPVEDTLTVLTKHVDGVRVLTVERDFALLAQALNAL